jgi:hypothetical protein
MDSRDILLISQSVVGKRGFRRLPDGGLLCEAHFHLAPLRCDLGDIQKKAFFIFGTSRRTAAILSGEFFPVCCSADKEEERREKRRYRELFDERNPNLSRRLIASYPSAVS